MSNWKDSSNLKNYKLNWAFLQIIFFMNFQTTLLLCFAFLNMSSCLPMLSVPKGNADTKPHYIPSHHIFKPAHRTQHLIKVPWLLYLTLLFFSILHSIELYSIQLYIKMCDRICLTSHRVSYMTDYTSQHLISTHLTLQHHSDLQDPS